MESNECHSLYMEFLFATFLNSKHSNLIDKICGLAKCFEWYKPFLSSPLSYPQL